MTYHWQWNQQMDFLKTFLKYFLFILLMATSSMNQAANAAFAAGCFWCAEHDFEQLPGVTKVISGYTGGKEVNPTYEEVSNGSTGHFESILVTYDPTQISYEKLLDFFWHNIDPEDGRGQFCDKGKQYRAVIFYSNENEKKLAEESKAKWLKSGRFKEIATLIEPASTFYPAEEYHQAYSNKNPIRYNFYRFQCGRDKRLKEIWGK